MTTNTTTPHIFRGIVSDHLDWSDTDTRRTVISGAVLPAILRASVHTKDQGVHRCIRALEDWCSGSIDVDIRAVYDTIAYAADYDIRDAVVSYPVAAAAVAAAIRAAAHDDARDDINRATGCAAICIAIAAGTKGSNYVAAYIAARADERGRQQQEIIATLSPHSA